MAENSKVFPLILSACSLVLASCNDPPEYGYRLTGPIVVGECSVPAGTALHLLRNVLAKSLKNSDGTCVLIPAGSIVTISSRKDSAARIEFPDGRVLVVPVVGARG